MYLVGLGREGEGDILESICVVRGLVRACPDTSSAWFHLLLLVTTSICVARSVVDSPTLLV